MSSDYIIPIDALLKESCTIELDLCEYTKETISIIHFPLYPYARQCDIDLSTNELHLSCSGSFRTYLDKWLEVNQIKHEKY